MVLENTGKHQWKSHCGWIFLLFMPFSYPTFAFTITNVRRFHQPPFINNVEQKHAYNLQLYESISPSSSETKVTNDDNQPFAILVQTEIVPERLNEFIKLIENNAIQSRKEPQCIRFDIIQSQEHTNQFFFYEIYQNNHSAIEYHKSQSHYQAWANFKESGGTISSVTYKANGLFLTE
jgi:quinol monooxygenase YgiN